MSGVGHAAGDPDPPAGLRPVTDGDARDVQDLVGGCFAAYPGCVLELDGLDAWMRAPATGYAHKGGGLWVVPGPAGLWGCGGWQPGSAADTVELKSLYVAAAARRRGLGAALVALVERTARAAGACRVELWTDTRFTDAHRLYERLGYVRGEGQRPLHDVSRSVEYPYAKIL